MAQAFVDLMNKVIHSFSKFTEHLLCARQSKEAEYTVLRSTRSPPAAAFHRQDSAENRHPSTFSDLDVLKISTPACNAAKRSITRSLMLENFPETSVIKREVQPNKLPTGQPSRRPLMAPKMPIKISLRRHFTILLLKSRNFFPFCLL